MSEMTIASRRLDFALALSNRVVVNLVSLLFFAPAFLFATLLRPAPAALVMLGCVGCLVLTLRNRPQVEFGALNDALCVSRFALYSGCAGLLLLLGGALHLTYTPMDWRIRDAVLADLQSGAFPISYDIDGATFMLRAPLGMYLAPAMVGKLLGFKAAHLALWLQNSLLLGSIFYLLGKLGQGWRTVAIMALFAGASIVGIALLTTLVGAPDPLRLLTYGFDGWHPAWQYSSSLVQLLWVPNHALPAWWLATLLLLRARGQVDDATVACGVAGAMFWSPLSVTPATLWIVGCVLWNFRASLVNARNWLSLAFGLCLLPIAIYLTRGTATIAHGVLEFDAAFVILYALFASAQFLSLLYIRSRSDFVPKEFVALVTFCMLLLVVLPFFRFGPANDLVMRGSIGALVVVAFVFAEVVLRAKTVDRRAWWLGVGLLAAGSPSAALEVGRALALRPYPASDCSLIQASRGLGDMGIPGNYVVDAASMPYWLIATEAAQAKPAAARLCWPDQAEVQETLAALHKGRYEKK
jgi:hypothetical protein